MGVPHPSERDHSYERFAQQPFYQTIDRELIRRAPRVHTAADLATGTGAIIGHLFELGKLVEPFQVIGVDLNRRDLARAYKKFARYANRVWLVEGSIEDMSFIADGTQQLVTCLNAIHLTDVPRTFAEAHRIAAPGATLLVSSAYEKTSAFPPDSRAKMMMGLLVKYAREKLKEQGFDNFATPVDLLKYTADDYRRFAQEAGFTEVDIETHRVELDREALKAFCDYSEFAEGAIPGVPIEASTEALIASVDPVYERFKTDTMARGMMFLSAKKPAA